MLHAMMSCNRSRVSWPMSLTVSSSSSGRSFRVTLQFVAVADKVLPEGGPVRRGVGKGEFSEVAERLNPGLGETRVDGLQVIIQDRVEALPLEVQDLVSFATATPGIRSGQVNHQ